MIFNTKVALKLALATIPLVAGRVGTAPNKKKSSPKAAGRRRELEGFCTLTILLDDWPEEVGWSIEDEAGTVVDRVIPGEYTEKGVTVSHPLDLQPESTYTFTIIDTHADGLAGDGEYGVECRLPQTVYVAGGSNYNSAESTTFVVPENVEQPAPVYEGQLVSFAEHNGCLTRNDNYVVYDVCNYQDPAFEWSYNEQEGLFRSALDDGKCLQAGEHPWLRILHCDPSNSLQHFYFDEGGKISFDNNRLCVAAPDSAPSEGGNILLGTCEDDEDRFHWIFD